MNMQIPGKYNQMTTHKNAHTEWNGSWKFEGNIQATQVQIPSRKLRVLKNS
jgi:hypothetical protein